MDFLVLCLIIGCASQTPVEQQAQFTEELGREVRDEMNMGREMAAKLLGHFGAWDGDPQRLEYINLVGQTLAKKCGRPELRFYFGILKTAEVNAYATPGGYIFVTEGLLREIQSESELAVVLGHEIAHVNERHMYHEIVPKKEVSAEQTVARIISRGHSDLGKSITQIVNKGLKILLEDGLGKEKEAEADAAGLIYAASVGYNPQNMLTLLKRLEARKKHIVLARSAPANPERIIRIEDFLHQHGLEDPKVADAALLETRFKKAFLR